MASKTLGNMTVSCSTEGGTAEDTVLTLTKGESRERQWGAKASSHGRPNNGVEIVTQEQITKTKEQTCSDTDTETIVSPITSIGPEAELRVTCDSVNFKDGNSLLNMESGMIEAPAPVSISIDNL